jgi:hypothetical protein
MQAKVATMARSATAGLVPVPERATVGKDRDPLGEASNSHNPGPPTREIVGAPTVAKDYGHRDGLCILMPFHLARRSDQFRDGIGIDAQFLKRQANQRRAPRYPSCLRGNRSECFGPFVPSPQAGTCLAGVPQGAVCLRPDAPDRGAPRDRAALQSSQPPRSMLTKFAFRATCTRLS